jgi:hypothetical protein
MAPSSLPSADTVVRACLDAIPVALHHVTTFGVNSDQLPHSAT